MIGATGAILLVYVILSAIFVPIRTSSDLAIADAAQSPQGPMYTAREEDDRIVIYAGESLVTRSDTRVSQLPKIDRIRLREGVDLFSEKELKAFVEDYCS